MFMRHLRGALRDIRAYPRGMSIVIRPLRPASGRVQPRGRLEVELPGLGHEVEAETAVRLLGDQPEARLLVHAAGSPEVALRPERDLPVARLPGEANALVHEPPPQAEAPGLRLEEEQAE